MPGKSPIYGQCVHGNSMIGCGECERERTGLQESLDAMESVFGKARIWFDVPAVPVPQPRQRHRVLAINGQHRAKNYTPKRDPVNAFKSSCQHAASESYTGPPLQVPLRLTLLFVMPRPKSMQWKSKPMPRVPHAKRPDVDNLAKSVKDSLSKLVWHDDSQIAQLDATKVIAAGDEQPHVRVKVEVI